MNDATTTDPSGGTEHDPGALDEFLRPALDAAVKVARERAAEDGPQAVPARLRPFLRVPTLPRAGWTAVRLAVEGDADLRAATAETVEEPALGRGPWLWLTRPEGWRDELDGLWEVWHDAHVQDAIDAEERSTTRQLERANETIARLESRVAQLEQILASTEGDLAHARAEAVASGSARDEAQTESRRLGRERADAVRQLKAIEERLAVRTAELRDARARPPEPVVEVATADAEVPREAVASGLAHVGGRLDDLSRALAAVIELVGAPDEIATPGANRHRRPVRVGRGIPDDSTTAADVLVSLPGSVTLIDGYNLTMTAWPSLGASDQRQALERAAAGVAARTGSEIHLVFDGDGEGGRPARTASSGVRVRFTSEDVEADDEILDLIGTIPLERPVVVVSDDRRVRHGARARGANVVGARQFQPLLVR